MRNKKILIPFLIIVLVILSLVILELTHVTHFTNMTNVKPATYDGPTSDQKKQEDSVNANNKKQLLEDTSTPSSPGAASKSIDITTKQELNGTVTIFTKLTGYSSGTCSLKVTNKGNTTSQSSDIIYQPEFSSCAGFSVPISSVGTGTWSLSLNVTSNNLTENKTASIEVN